MLHGISILTSWYTDVLWQDGAKKLSKVTPYNEDNAMILSQEHMKGRSVHLEFIEK